ncbi:MAG: ABC transporter permease [Thermoguttaceae bacterium]
MELIRLENITKTYHLGEVDVPVLRGISLSIARGEMVALMGASGSGKTTLMNILGCLDRPSDGRYWLDGQEMSRLTPNQRAMVRTDKLGFVFQNFNLLPRTKAIQNVLMPLDYAPRHAAGSESRQWAKRLLERVGIAERANHEPSQMSGGQQQRVAIARALVNRPALVLADEPTGNLDSHTSVEILRMFQELNAEGITVVLVTHDANVAAYAHRTIRIVDGQIADDPVSSHRERVVAPPHVRPAAHGLRLAAIGGATATAVAERSTPPVESVAAAAVSTKPSPAPSTWYGDRRAAAPRRTSAPLLSATFRTALLALQRNKMRSALTALGVIIGVAAVIAMTEIGNGSKLALQKTIASMGANNLLILPGWALSGSVNLGTGAVQTLKPGDVDAILEQCPAVAEVAPLVGSRAQIIYGNRNWIPKSIVGTTPAYITVREWDIQEGNIFSDHDVRSGAKVCLVGATIKRELFPDESPVGKEIRIQNVLFRVIGLLEGKGANMLGQDQDDVVLAPWTTVRFRVNGVGNATAVAATTSTIKTLNNLYAASTARYPAVSEIQQLNAPRLVRFLNVDWMIAKAVSADQIPQAIEQITSLLRERHHIQPGRDNDFDIRDMAEVTRAVTSSMALVETLLLIVAAISLMVGGVGIMNIMLVSVTERTREIGLRMAVGARSHHILRQFLVEAVLLCLAGGCLGIALGRGTSILVRSVKQWPTAASLSAILVAVAVSAGVGIAFGFYPAWKASRLDPIEALRYE